MYQKYWSDAKKNIYPPKFCQNTLHSLLEFIYNLNLNICNYFTLDHQHYDLKRYKSLVNEIIDNVCCAASPDIVEDELYRITNKYMRIIEAPGLFKLIVIKLNRLINSIDIFPELRWIVIKAFVDVYKDPDISVYYKLVDILSVICVVDTLDGQPLIRKDGEKHHLYDNCVRILHACITKVINCTNPFIIDLYRSIFYKAEALFSSSQEDVSAKYLFRSYIFAFSNDHDFLNKLDALFDRLLRNTTGPEISQCDLYANGHSIWNENFLCEPDKILYEIFLHYDQMFSFIMNGFVRQ